jgi:hypothetical protein
VDPVAKHLVTWIGRIDPADKPENVTSVPYAIVTFRFPAPPMYKARVGASSVESLRVTAAASYAETVASAVRYAGATMTYSLGLGVFLAGAATGSAGVNLAFFISARRSR